MVIVMLKIVSIILAFACCLALNAQIVDRTQVQNLSPTSSVISYLNGYDVDVETHYSGTTAGAKLIACLADATLPVGAICDMRGIVSEVSQPVAGGTAPIEIGRNGPQHVIFPDCIAATFANCGLILQTISTTLPTPSAVTPTCTTGGGTLTGGGTTYFVNLNYYTGDATSTSSTETSCVMTTAGNLSVVLPATCPQYTSQVTVNISTTTGTETAQLSGACGTTVSFTATDLYPHSTTAPTSATPLPAIILHNNKSTIYAPMSGQNGFPFYTTGTFVASDMLATTDKGYSSMSNLYFDNNANYAIVSGIYDRGAFVGSLRDHLTVSPGSAATGSTYQIYGQYNDISFYVPHFDCGGTASSLAISWAPETGGDVEAGGRINIFGGLVNAQGCASTTSAVVLTGRSGAGSATGFWTSQTGSFTLVNFWGTSFELGSNTPNGILATDFNNVSLLAVFGQRASNGGTAFLNIQQTYTPSGQTSGVAGFSIISSPNISNWTNIVTNGATTDTSDTLVVSGANWEGSYEYGGGIFSKTSGSIPPGKVIANLPTLFDSSSPITLWSHLNLQQTTAPAASSCTGGTAAGTDDSFKITGITSATTCTVTFNTAIKLGICVATSQLAADGIGITSVTTTAVVFNIVSGTTTIYAHCF